MNLTLEGLDLQIDVIQLCVSFTSLPSWYQETFLQHLQDEYAGLDDEFGDITASIIASFYQWIQATTPNTKRTTIRNILKQEKNFDWSLEEDEQYTMLHLCEDLEAHLSVALDSFSKDQVQKVQIVLQSMSCYAKDELSRFANNDEDNASNVYKNYKPCSSWRFSDSSDDGKEDICKANDHPQEMTIEQDTHFDISSPSSLASMYNSLIHSNYYSRSRNNVSSQSSSDNDTDSSSFNEEDFRNRHVY